MAKQKRITDPHIDQIVAVNADPDGPIYRVDSIRADGVYLTYRARGFTLMSGGCMPRGALYEPTREQLLHALKDIGY